jgi:hypothetical protein
MPYAWPYFEQVPGMTGPTDRSLIVASAQIDPRLVVTASANIDPGIIKEPRVHGVPIRSPGRELGALPPLRFFDGPRFRR